MKWFASTILLLCVLSLMAGCQSAGTPKPKPVASDWCAIQTRILSKSGFNLKITPSEWAARSRPSQNYLLITKGALQKRCSF
ncbi:hypothetical protein [Flexibacterium corallicola]|uniref:hypothetical protein n=1 Tax=Flexibacterium corallicola TaxID=3037259 RepID=UPI00286F8C2F|nr:hypothetical protein [Pseudovibrio sp. M1P-2-3]